MGWLSSKPDPEPQAPENTPQSAGGASWGWHDNTDLPVQPEGDVPQVGDGAL